jgi:hypothetical protein
VIVAVAVMRMVEMAVDPVVDVIAMRHRLVAATRAVGVIWLVPGATGRRHLDHVLVDMILMRVVEMAVVQKIDMIAVAHRRMAAIGAMPVRVIGVSGGSTIRHRKHFPEDERMRLDVAGTACTAPSAPVKGDMAMAANADNPAHRIAAPLESPSRNAEGPSAQR